MNKENTNLIGTILMNVSVSIFDDVSDLTAEQVLEKIKNKELNLSIGFIDSECDFSQDDIIMICGEIDENLEIDSINLKNL